MEQCQTCRFYHFDGSFGATGRFLCRRFPPNPEWSKPFLSDWCGEYVLQPPAPETVTPSPSDAPK